MGVTMQIDDRTYYRRLRDDELIDRAKETGNELALVLAERLRSTGAGKYPTPVLHRTHITTYGELKL